MNLATIALKLYLRNPIHRWEDEDPLIVLPNGKRIVIQTWDEPIEPSSPFDTFTFYRVMREHRSSRGSSLIRIGDDCYDLESVARLIAEESAKPEPRMPGFMFYPRRR